MYNLPLLFNEVQNPRCICAGLLDSWDIACFSLGGGHGKYQFLDENSPLVAQALADCEGLSFDTVRARPTRIMHNLPGFLPVVPHHSQKLFEYFTPPYVGIMLGEVVTDQLKVYIDIRKRMGIPDGVRMILLCYGVDRLIEDIWPRHRQIFEQLLQAGIDLIAPINYSIWHNQPHLERLINIKRSLIAYQTLQDLGFDVVPHVYWSGPTDLRRWAAWLKVNQCVHTIAIDLQTIKSHERALWNKSVEELRGFSAQLDRPVHYIISGPQAPARIKAIIDAVGTNITFTNVSAAIRAWNNRAIIDAYPSLQTVKMSDAHKSTLFADNNKAYGAIIHEAKKEHVNAMLLRKLQDELSCLRLKKPIPQKATRTKRPAQSLVVKPENANLAATIERLVHIRSKTRSDYKDMLEGQKNSRR